LQSLSLSWSSKLWLIAPSHWWLWFLLTY